MSRLKTARRRLSLLAGSSLAAASLLSIGPAALVLAPGAALAADECTPVPPTLGNGPGPVSDDPTLNGAAADTFSCLSGIYNTGIEYVSEGNLTVTQIVTDDVFIKSDPYFRLIGEGADNVTLSATRTVWSFTGVQLTSQTGDITANLGFTLTSDANGAALSAVSSAGGDIVIGNVTAPGVQGGGAVGIRAITTGAGTIWINAGSAAGDVRGIEAITGTGDITITVGSVESTSGTGVGVYTQTSGLATINLGSGQDSYHNTLLRPVGPRAVVNNAGEIWGSIDFTGLTDTSQLNIQSGGVWHLEAADTTLMGAADDTVNVLDGGHVISQTQRQFPNANPILGSSTIDFGAGDDAFNNDGVLAVGPYVKAQATYVTRGDLRLENLETFTNTGLILMGAPGMQTTGSPGDIAALETDGFYDDILYLPGVHFVGGTGGQIAMDVNLNRAQSGCADSLRDAGGILPAADCVTIPGGETSGVTSLVLTEFARFDRGAYFPTGTVLVEVAGGTSQQGDFVIDPTSTNYSAEFGGVIDKGAFFYALLYNEDAQQHTLVGLPSANTLQMPLIAQSAQNIWRTTTQTWLDRQADMRGGFEGGIGGGAWLRVATEFSSRETAQTVSSFGSSFVFDNSFDQSVYAVTGGWDLLVGGGANSAYVVGITAGYTHAELEYVASPNTARFDGWTGGVYGSFMMGGFFLDAILNANKLTLDNDVPSLNLFPAGSLLSTDLVNIGAQVETGWRIAFLGNGFFEPQASAVYLTSKFEDLNIRSQDALRQGVVAEFDDPTSLRASVGARVGLDQNYGGFHGQISLLGRLWNEFEGENNVVLHNIGSDYTVTDDFSGQFTEVGLGASVSGVGGAVSGFLNVGSKFGQDYDAVGGTAGVRVSW